MDYPVALLDASVLFSGSLRDLLMRLAVNELFTPKWTDLIHEEWIHALLTRRPDLNRGRRLTIEGNVQLISQNNRILMI